MLYKIDKNYCFKILNEIVYFCLQYSFINKADKYYKLKDITCINDENILHAHYDQKAQILLRKKRFDLALETYKQVYSNAQKAHNKHNQLIGLTGVIEVCLQKDDLDEAQKNLNLGFVILDCNEGGGFLSLMLQEIRVLLRRKMYIIAFRKLKKIPDSPDNLLYYKSYLVAEIYYLQKKYKKALKNFLVCKDLAKSVKQIYFNEEQQSSLLTKISRCYNFLDQHDFSKNYSMQSKMLMKKFLTKCQS